MKKENDDLELFENLDDDKELNMLLERYDLNKNDIITGRQVAEMVGLTDVYDKSKELKNTKKQNNGGRKELVGQVYKL